MKRNDWWIVFAVCIPILILCLYIRQAKHERKQEIQSYIESRQAEAAESKDISDSHKTEAYKVPDGWNLYVFSKSFTLCIPSSLEMRNDSDAYSVDLRRRHIEVNRDNVVFQQKGLSKNKPEAYETYCRVMIKIEEEFLGCFESAFCNDEMSDAEVENYREVARALSDNATLLYSPKVRRVKIGEAYAVEVEYERNGYEGHTTKVYNYWLSNSDRRTLIIIAFRQNDKFEWENTVLDIIKSFNWLKIND